MIDGLVRILLFQGSGEVVAEFLLLLVPGPVGRPDFVGAIAIP